MSSPLQEQSVSRTGLGSLAALLALTVTLVLQGCSSADRFKVDPPKVDDVADIGSLRLSLLSIAPWEAYREALQPKFTLSASDALTSVLVSTRTVSEQSLDSTRATLKAALPTAIETSKLATSLKDGTSSVTRETSKQTGAGDISTATVDTSAGSTPGAAAERLARVEASGLAPSDPRLKYQMATALMQEVQLLNRYILDAPEQEGFQRYVARIQVTLMPRTRHLPYDAYVNLSFFNKIDDPKGRLPRVYPMFATDSMESSLASADLASMRQLAAAISALSTTAITGSIENVFNRIESALGRDTNSLFTIGRLADNAVRVRLGAPQQVRTDYAMVPRTETITVLLLVPKDSEEPLQGVPRPELVAHAYSEFMHVTKVGVSVRDVSARKDNEYRDKIIEWRELHEVRPQFELVYQGLYAAMVDGNASSFRAHADSLCVKATLLACSAGRYAEWKELWDDFAYFRPSFSVDAFPIPLPLIVKPRLPPPQSVAFFDDGEKSATVSVRGGVALEGRALCASVSMTSPPEVWYATSIVNDEERRSISATFPSFKKLGVDSARIEKSVLRVFKGADGSGCAAADKNPSPFESLSLRSVVTTPTPDKAAFSMVPTVGFVVDAEPRLIEVNLVPDAAWAEGKVTMLVLNAIIDKVSVNGVQAKHLGGSVEVTVAKAPARTVVRFELEGLGVGEVVTIEARDEKKRASDALKLTVRKGATSAGGIAAEGAQTGKQG